MINCVNKVNEKITSVWLMALILFLTAEYWIFGKNSYVALYDNMDSVLARNVIIGGIIKDGGMLYNYAFTGSGIDAFKNIFFPALNIIFVLFEGHFAYQLIFILGISLLVFGYFLLAKDVLKVEKNIAILGALMIAIYYGVGHHDQILGFLTYPLLSLLIWLAQMTLCSGRKIKIILSALVIGFLYGLLSMPILGVPFVTPILFLWFLFIKKENVVSQIFIFLIVFFIAAMIASFPSIFVLLGGVDPNFQHHRLNWTFQGEHWGSPLHQALIGLKEYFLGAKVPTLIIAIYFIKFRKNLENIQEIFKNKVVRLTLVGLFCAVSPGIFSFFYSELLRTGLYPAGLEGGRFHEFVKFFSVTAAVVAISEIYVGLGSDNRIFNKKNFIRISFIAFIAVGLQIKFVHLWDWLKFGGYITNYDNKQLKYFRVATNHLSPFRVATIPTGLYKGKWGVLFPEYVQVHGFESADGLANIYSKSYKDYWASVTQSEISKDPAWGTYFNEWGNKIYLNIADNLHNGSIDVDEFFDINLLSNANVKFIISRRPLVGESLKLVISPTVNPPDWNHVSLIEKIKTIFNENIHGREFYVYENMHSLNRIYLHSAPNRNNEENSLKLKFYSYDKLEVLTKTKNQDILVLANSYSPYWKAFVDGVPSKVLLINNTFMGVDLTKGDHKVEFKYDPPYRHPIEFNLKFFIR